jgi:hypothetical protein
VSTGRTFPTGVGAPILLEGMQMIGRVRPLLLIHRFQALLPVFVDETKACIARIYNAALGGKDNYEVDREVIRVPALHAASLQW